MDCGGITEPGEPKMLCGMVLGRIWVAYLGCPTTTNAHSLVLSMLALACGSRRRDYHVNIQKMSRDLSEDKVFAHPFE